MKYWWASSMMPRLGYKSKDAFSRLIERTVSSLIDLEIPYYENVIHESRLINHHHTKDFKLSLLACIIIVIHSDHRKVLTRNALAKISLRLKEYDLTVEDFTILDRLALRKQVTELHKRTITLIKPNAQQFIKRFNDSAYLSIYQTSKELLLERYGLPPEATIYDYSKPALLSAHIIRLQLIIEKLKEKPGADADAIESIYAYTGQRTRLFIFENLGIYPEEIGFITSLAIKKKKIKDAYLLFSKST